MEKYETLELEIIVFDAEDVIGTSGDGYIDTSDYEHPAGQ